jgi:WD40 repeat protein
VLAYLSGKQIVVRNLLTDAAVWMPDNPASPSHLPVLVYRGHNYKATAVRISPSGAYVASGDERGTLRVWALDQEEHLCKYEATHLLAGASVTDVAWDGESKRIAACGARAGGESRAGDCAKVFSWDTGVTVGQLSQHLKGRISSLAFKPQRPMRLVTAGKDDHALRFHQGPPFQRVPPENGVPAEACHVKGGIHAVRYSHSGAWIVSVGSDRAIVLYEGKTLAFQSKLEHAHDATIYDVAWSADDSTILTASGDGTCQQFAVHADGTLSSTRVWKVAEFQLGGRPFEKVPVGGNQVGCAYVAGNVPVSVSLNGQIAVLPLDEGNMKILTGHDAPIAGLAVDAARNVFYTGDTDGILCEWDLVTGQPQRRLEPVEGNEDLTYVTHTGAIAGLACLPESSTLLSVGWDDKVRMAPNGVVGMATIEIGAQPSSIASGKALAVVCTVQGLLLVRTGQASTLMAIPYEAHAVCVDAHDQMVYVGGNDCNVHVYAVDGDTLKEVHVIENGHLKPIHALSLSHDGTKLAAGDGRDVCVWDLSAANKYAAVVAKGRWCFHVQKVTCLAWSLDDAVLVSGGADDSLYVWNVQQKMKRIHYPYAHRGGVTGVEFVPNVTAGTYRMISVGADAVVHVWDLTQHIQEKFS